MESNNMEIPKKKKTAEEILDQVNFFIAPSKKEQILIAMQEYAQQQVESCHSQVDVDLEELRNEFDEADVEGEFD